MPVDTLRAGVQPVEVFNEKRSSLAMESSTVAALLEDEALTLRFWKPGWLRLGMRLNGLQTPPILKVLLWTLPSLVVTST
jgi:hypothetical protein